MHSYKSAILRAFKANPGASLSTKQLLAFVLDQHAETTRQKRQQGDAGTAKDHRRLLYHIRGLLDEGLLRIHARQSHGELIYRLAISSGELLVQGKRDAVSILKHATAANFSIADEEKGKVLSRTQAFHRVESYALHAARYARIEDVQQAAIRALPHIGDLLVLHGISDMLQSESTHAVGALKRILERADRQDVAVSASIDLQRINSITLVEEVLKQFHHPHAIMLRIPPDISSRTLNRIGNAARQSGIQLHIQYSQALTIIHVGRAGPYDMRPLLTSDLPGLPLSLGSYAIDLARIQTAHELKTVLLNTVKTLLARVEQQYKVQETLRGLRDGGEIRRQLRAAPVYIRFWNQDWGERGIQLLEELTSRIHRFCRLETKMFASAGLPIGFSSYVASCHQSYHEDLEPRESQDIAYHPTDTRRLNVRSSQSTESVMLRARQTLESGYPCVSCDFSSQPVVLTLSHYL